MEQIKFRVWDHRTSTMVCGAERDADWVIFLTFPERYTIQQWTRLYDKNKYPIYEGDIVVDRFGDSYEVRWSGCGWKPFTYYGGGEVENTECHVASNIFEQSNPKGKLQCPWCIPGIDNCFCSPKQIEAYYDV